MNKGWAAHTVTIVRFHFRRGQGGMFCREALAAGFSRLLPQTAPKP